MTATAAATPKKPIWERVKDRWNYAKAHPWELNLGRALKNSLITGGAIGGGILLTPFVLKILGAAIPAIGSLANGASQIAGQVLDVGAHAAQVASSGFSNIAANSLTGIPVGEGIEATRAAIAAGLEGLGNFVRP